MLYLVSNTILYVLLFNKKQTVLCFTRFVNFHLIWLTARVLSWSHTQAATTECWSVLPGAIFIDNGEILYSSSCCRKWFVFVTMNIIVSGFIKAVLISTERACNLNSKKCTGSINQLIDWSITGCLSLHSLLTHLTCVWLPGCWSLSTAQHSQLRLPCKENDQGLQVPQWLDCRQSGMKVLHQFWHLQSCVS